MRKQFLVTILLPSVFVAACAAERSPQPTAQPASREAAGSFVESGFLTTDYARLAAVAPGAARHTYLNPDKKLSDYDSIFLDRITVWRDQDQKEPVESADFQALVDDLHALVAREFGKTFKLAAKPGPGVGRLRIGLISIDSPEDRLDVYVSEGEPSPIESNAALPAGLREFGVKAWVEAEMVDTATKEPIFAVVDRVTDVIPHAGPITTWQDLHQALEAWAKQGAERVKALRQ